MSPSIKRAMAVVLVSVLAAVGFNILITVTLSERARDGQRQSSCEIARTQLAIYREAPPSTSTGEAAQAAWRTAYSDWRCADLLTREKP